MRACEPDIEGYVERDGVKIGYEVFGEGAPTVLLLPTWTIIHSRFWKAQVPYLSRHYRVITFDRPGNGRSDRPLQPDAYTVDAVVNQALAVMEATGTNQVIAVSLSQGAQEALKLAADHPDRVLGAVFIGAGLTLEPDHPERVAAVDHFLEPYPPEPQGWERLNAQYWLDHYEDFVDFFFSECFPEPHSTKQREDCQNWARETTPEVLLADTQDALSPSTVLEWAERVSVPTLVIHGSDDRISPLATAETLAGKTRGQLVVLDGAGHIPLARDPVCVNLLIREFVDRLAASQPRTTRWHRSRARPRRALYISSPIGLGHASATSPSPTSSASSIRAWRSTGSPSTPSPAYSKLAEKASTPPAPIWPTSRATWSQSPPSTICTASRPGGRWTKSSSPTSWCSTMSPEKNPTTCGSATRRGSSTTSCTRTPS